MVALRRLAVPSSLIFLQVGLLMWLKDLGAVKSSLPRQAPLPVQLLGIQDTPLPQPAGLSCWLSPLPWGTILAGVHPVLSTPLSLEPGTGEMSGRGACPQGQTGGQPVVEGSWRRPGTAVRGRVTRSIREGVPGERRGRVVRPQPRSVGGKRPESGPRESQPASVDGKYETTSSGGREVACPVPVPPPSPCLGPSDTCRPPSTTRRPTPPQQASQGPSCWEGA